MSLNVGSTDRIIRFALAVILALAIVLGWVSGVVAIIAGVLAAIFLVTGIVKFCPLYFPFGIKTNKAD